MAISEEFQTQIREIIKKNLPESVGSELKSVLDKAEKDARSVINLNESLITKEAQLRAASATIEKLNEEIKTHEELSKREATISARELKLELTMAQFQLQCVNNSLKHATDVAMGLVRNTEFRSSVFDSKTVSHPVNNNGYTSIVPANNTYSSTVENKIS